jgi:hypothetical protein
MGDILNNDSDCSEENCKNMSNAASLTEIFPGKSLAGDRRSFISVEWNDDKKIYKSAIHYAAADIGRLCLLSSPTRHITVQY